MHLYLREKRIQRKTADFSTSLHFARNDKFKEPLNKSSMSRVLTRIVHKQGLTNGRSNPLIRSQGGPGVAKASRSTGREVGAIALPFGSHPKALSPQRLWNLLRLWQGTPKMGYSCQNPHGVPQASGLPWAEGWRNCQMRGRSAVLQCLRRGSTIHCAPRLASHPGKPSARPCGT